MRNILAVTGSDVENGNTNRWYDLSMCLVGGCSGDANHRSMKEEHLQAAYGPAYKLK